MSKLLYLPQPLCIHLCVEQGQSAHGPLQEDEVQGAHQRTGRPPPSANVNSGITVRTVLISRLWDRPSQQEDAQGQGLTPASVEVIPGDRSHAACRACTAQGSKSRTSTCSSSLTRPPPRQPPRIPHRAERARVCNHSRTRTPPVPAPAHPGNVDLAGGQQVGEPMRGPSIFAYNLHVLTQPSHLCTEHF